MPLQTPTTGAPRPILMTSTPRSGTDWFCHRILSLRDGEGGYYREFFNPLSNRDPDHRAALAAVFGSEVHWKNVAVPWEEQMPALQEAFDRTWGTIRGAFRFVKEVWVAFKTGFLCRHFDAFAYLGHRQFTFPGGSSPADTVYWWSQGYCSLLANAGRLDDDLRELVAFCRREAYSPHRAICAAQVLISYQIARDAHRYGLAVIEHRKLAHLGTAAEVADYLAALLPARLFDDGLADRVMGNRSRFDLEKAVEYHAMNVEGFCRRLIRRLPAFQEYFL